MSNRDNCIAPDIAFIVWTTNTKSARARARVALGRVRGSRALGRDGRMIDLRPPSGPPPPRRLLPSPVSSPLPASVRSVFLYLPPVRTRCCRVSISPAARPDQSPMVSCCIRKEGEHVGEEGKENTLSHAKPPPDLVFQAVLADEKATQEFLAFTQAEFSSENLEFYLARACGHTRVAVAPRSRARELLCGRGPVPGARRVRTGLILLWCGRRGSAPESCCCCWLVPQCSRVCSPRRCEGSRSGARRTATLRMPRASGAGPGRRSGPALRSLGAVLALGAALPLGAALVLGPWQGYGTPWKA